MRPGPRPVIREEVIDTIRLAIKQGNELYLHYRSPRTKRSSGRRLQPYGFLFGKQHYLVGMSPDRHPGEARLFALAHIRRASCLDRTFERDPAFRCEVRRALVRGVPGGAQDIVEVLALVSPTRWSSTSPQSRRQDKDGPVSMVRGRGRLCRMDVRHHGAAIVQPGPRPGAAGSDGVRPGTPELRRPRPRARIAPCPDAGPAAPSGVAPGMPSESCPSSA